jgi:hypothetical protein
MPTQVTCTPIVRPAGALVTLAVTGTLKQLQVAEGACSHLKASLSGSLE